MLIAPDGNSTAGYGSVRIGKIPSRKANGRSKEIPKQTKISFDLTDAPFVKI